MESHRRESGSRVEFSPATQKMRPTGSQMEFDLRKSGCGVPPPQNPRTPGGRRSKLGSHPVCCPEKSGNLTSTTNSAKISTHHPQPALHKTPQPAKKPKNHLQAPSQAPEPPLNPQKTPKTPPNTPKPNKKSPKMNPNTTQAPSARPTMAIDPTIMQLTSQYHQKLQQVNQQLSDTYSSPNNSDKEEDEEQEA